MLPDVRIVACDAVGMIEITVGAPDIVNAGQRRFIVLVDDNRPADRTIDAVALVTQMQDEAAIAQNAKTKISMWAGGFGVCHRRGPFLAGGPLSSDSASHRRGEVSRLFLTRWGLWDTRQAMDEDRLDVAVRLQGPLSKRLDAEVDRLKAEQPGPGWTRSGVMRMALELYLRSMEKKGEIASATG